MLADVSSSFKFGKFSFGKKYTKSPKHGIYTNNPKKKMW